MASFAGNPEIFLADVSLQGSEIPAYVKWQAGAVSRIKLVMPVGMHLVEAFNAEVLKDGDELIASSFGVDGYAGFTFRTDLLENPREKLPVEFHVIGHEGEEHVTTKTLLAFRPIVEAELSPRPSNVSNPEVANGAVTLRNVGAGTAIVKLECFHGDGIELEKPRDFEEFVKGFKADLGDRAPKLIELHPSHEGILAQMADILSAEVDFSNEQRMAEMRAYFEKLERALTDDEMFGNDFVDAVSAAFFNNVNLTTYFEKVVEYLQSLPGGKFIITNPMHTLVIPPGKHKLQFIVHATDKQYNKYDPISLPPTTLQANEELRVPVHRLLKIEVQE